MKLQSTAVPGSISGLLQPNASSPAAEGKFGFQSSQIALAAAKLLIAIFFIVGSITVAGATTVTLSPGANIQSAVNNNPAGTTFVLRPGTYRGSSVTSLKNGD